MSGKNNSRHVISRGRRGQVQHVRSSQVMVMTPCLDDTRSQKSRFWCWARTKANYLWEEVVFFGNLIQHLMSFDGRTDIPLQHLRRMQVKIGIGEMAQPGGKKLKLHTIKPTCSPGKKASRESIQVRAGSRGLWMWTSSSSGGWLMYFIMEA